MLVVQSGLGSIGEMLRVLLNYLRILGRNLWFRWFFILSLISTGTTFYASFHPGFLLPKSVTLVVALLALFISPYDVYKRQWSEIQGLLRENSELKDFQDKRSATDLADLISDLEDNLNKARSPASDRQFGAGTYIRPSTDLWKAVRNKLRLEPRTRVSLNRVYTMVDRWCSIVDSGLRPGLGSPELDLIVGKLRVEIPALLEELRKAQTR